MDELLCVDKVKNKELFDWASSTLKKKKYRDCPFSES